MQKSARQHATRNLSRTFVLLDDEQSHIIMGYFTMTLREVHPEKLVDSRLNRYPHPIPAANLARLAVDKKYQGNSSGRLLIVEAMKRALTISEAAGLVGLFVDAKDSASADYYEKLRFIPNSDYELVLLYAVGYN